ncbi:hypothetical protein BD410DRAFT_797287 [Rickenella mellea]|uniref:Uncharacterized protein n=1 Tax=Rickenella mellea TaxID=50990 RepID=A0A4Y7PFX2_9AGAM|nr:hypothetical protein BD410DRAFT_797287 [Rickenella mellea]
MALDSPTRPLDLLQLVLQMSFSQMHLSLAQARCCVDLNLVCLICCHSHCSRRRLRQYYRLEKLCCSYPPCSPSFDHRGWR